MSDNPDVIYTGITKMYQVYKKWVNIQGDNSIQTVCKFSKKNLF